MQGRKTVTFKVSNPFAEKDKEGKIQITTKWLDASGEWVDNDCDGIEFTLYKSPRIVERQRIDVQTHEMAGGLSEWLDLQKGVDNASKACFAICESQLWPDGRPEVTGAALIEQQQAIAEAWDGLKDNAKSGWETLKAMQMRLTSMATWKVLVVDPPEGWEDLSETEIDVSTFYAIVDAWTETTEALNTSGGAKRPSE